MVDALRPACLSTLDPELSLRVRDPDGGWALPLLVRDAAGLLEDLGPPVLGQVPHPRVTVRSCHVGEDRVIHGVEALQVIATYV